jgi:hypothetical protein
MSVFEPLCRDLMLPQFPLSYDQLPSIKIETVPPTCLTEKLEGEDRNWTGADRKKQRKDSFYF